MRNGFCLDIVRSTLLLGALFGSGACDDLEDVDATEGCHTISCFRGVCERSPGGPHCLCELGWDGPTCDQCADEYVLVHERCVEASSQCAPECSHGTCAIVVDDVPMCVCDSGYAGVDCSDCDAGFLREGPECRPALGDPCESSPCRDANRSVCVPVPTASGATRTYLCQCDEGFSLRDGACVP